MSRITPRRCRFVVFLCVLATALPVSLSAGPASLRGRLTLKDIQKPLNAYDAAVVERARAGAARKLSDPEWVKVLTDFMDSEGRTLDRNLETWGMTPVEYVQIVSFWDGSAMPACKRTSVQLFTSPGLPPIHVCPAGKGALNSRLAQIQRRNSGS